MSHQNIKTIQKLLKEYPNEDYQNIIDNKNDNLPLSFSKTLDENCKLITYITWDENIREALIKVLKINKERSGYSKYTLKNIVNSGIKPDNMSQELFDNETLRKKLEITVWEYHLTGEVPKDYRSIGIIIDKK